jgi:hypothetical protein
MWSNGIISYLLIERAISSILEYRSQVPMNCADTLSWPGWSGIKYAFTL